MTPFVNTRFYRAPEVILVEPTYGFEQDIWGAGCILAELLLFQKRKSTEKRTNSLDEQIMFPGDSCFPLSPVASAKKSACEGIEVSSDDQLLKILEVLGAPEEADCEFISSEWTRNYLQKIKRNNTTPVDSLREKFQDCSPELVDLLKAMLQFNPEKRLSAMEYIQMPLFDDIRDASLEVTKSKKLNLKVDQEVQSVDPKSEDFDFQKNKFKHLIISEAKKIRVKI